MQNSHCAGGCPEMLLLHGSENGNWDGGGGSGGSSSAPGLWQRVPEIPVHTHEQQRAQNPGLS